VIPNGTGFTITTGAAPDLNRTHLIVGRVIEGMDVLAELDKLPVVKNNSSSPFFIVGKAAGDKRANVAELGFDRPFKKVAISAAGIVES
jgi:peptidyl-prolyl cis-trans isomerase B (cyclophilin B)